MEVKLWERAEDVEAYWRKSEASRLAVLAKAKGNTTEMEQRKWRVAIAKNTDPNAPTKKSLALDELDTLAKRLQKPGEPYENAYVRGLDTAEGRKLHADTRAEDAHLTAVELCAVVRDRLELAKRAAARTAAGMPATFDAAIRKVMADEALDYASAVPVAVKRFPALYREYVASR